MLTICDLKIEYKNQPIDIDEPSPRISWTLESDENDTKQIAYRIMVNHGLRKVWDSGKIESAQSLLHTYDGERLLPSTRYDILVEVLDNHGNQASAESYFETGLCGKYSGLWISYRQQPIGVPVFGKEFCLTKPVKRAKLYASALGVYEACLNGSRIGDYILAPGWTSYFYRIEYQSYDITNYIEKNNKIEFTVANGWFCGEVGYFHRKNHYGNRTAVWALMLIEYEDGSNDTLVTDESWYVTSKEVVTAEIYDGQTIDKTRLEEKRMPATRLEYPFGVLVSQECEPVRITERIAPIAVFRTPNGHTAFDFGRNLTGCVEVRIKGYQGEKVVLRHSEVLDKDGNLYFNNLRGIKAEDTFILSGGEDTFFPSLTFHGFRYVQIEAREELIRKENFTACAFRTDYEETGSFECSNTLISKLYENIRNSQKGNFIDIPTDCPQRDERLGWTGDAQIFGKTAAFNGNVQLFFKKWLKDVNVETTVEYGVPHTVPDIIAKYPEDPGVARVNEKGAAGWGDAATIIPCEMYNSYGDKKILAEQYPLMRKWVEFIRKETNEKGLWQSGFQYGDWLALDGGGWEDERSGATNPYLIASAFYAHSVDLIASAGEILGYSESKKYRKLYKDICESFKMEYLSPDGKVLCDTQTACLLILQFHLADEYRENILNTLVENIRNHNNHLTTGFVGTPYLLTVLTENGEHELAGKLMLQEDYPSWLYQVKMGATTIWERWNAMLSDGSIPDTGMTSFNHYAYGAVGNWLTSCVGGINAKDAGYKTVCIKPMPFEGITWAKCRHKSLYGEIRSEWEIQNNKFLLTVEIPANTSAEIIFPDSLEKVIVSSGIYSFERNYLGKGNYEKTSI